MMQTQLPASLGGASLRKYFLPRDLVSLGPARFIQIPGACFSARAHSVTEPSRFTATARALTVDSPATSQQVKQEVHYVNSEERPGYFTVAGKVRLRGVDPKLVWQILTSYDNCQRVFKTIESSEVHIKDGKTEVRQRAAWSFLAFSGSFDCWLAVNEDALQRRLTFTLIKSSFMRDFEGRWHVTEEANGEGSTDCVVEHVLSVQPIVPIPQPFTYYARPIFVKQVEGILQDLQREITRQVALPASSSN